MRLVDRTGRVASVPARPRLQPGGVGFAVGAMLTSGVAVFVNTYGVGRAPDGVTYTTAKNMVAALVLFLVAIVATTVRAPGQPRRPVRSRDWGLLGAVAVLGGGVAFALFFEGLARLSSAGSGDPLRAGQAQSLHKLLLLAGVAVLAPVVLRERLRWWHGVIVVLLLVAYEQLAGGFGHVGAGVGEVLVAAAAVLWAAEAVTVRSLLRSLSPLTVALARMGGGVVVLVGWLWVDGRLGSLAWDASWWGWAVVTGGVLAIYVLLWMAALARAGALDVTAVLAGAVGVTALLDRLAAHHVTQHGTGLALSVLGAAMAAGAAALTATRARRADVTT